MALGLAARAIITKGLHCGSAKQGLITSHFSLFCVTPTPPPPPSGGGGPYPERMGAHNQIDHASDIFQPVHDNFYDTDRAFKNKKQVVIRIELGTFHVEKIYLVPIEKANLVIKVTDLLNKTRGIIKVFANNIRKVHHNIKISIKRLRRRG